MTDRYYLIVYQSGETPLAEIVKASKVGSTGSTVFFGEIKEGKVVADSKGNTMPPEMNVTAEFSMRVVMFYRLLTKEEMDEYQKDGKIPKVVAVIVKNKEMNPQG